MNQRQPDNTSPQSLTVGESYRKAVELLNAGRLDEAHNVCMSIVAARPKQPDVHSLLGAIAYQKRDDAAAVAHFRRALKLDPDNLAIRLNLAKTHRDFGQWADAAKVFETIVKRTPDDSAALYDLGKAYDHLEQYAAAAQHYRRALVGTAEPDIVETALATALLKLGEYAEADTNYNAVLGRTPGCIPALINLAVLRDIQGRMDDALALFDTALAHDPNNVEAHFHHALALIARERLAEGWAEYVWRYQRPRATTLHDRFQMAHWQGEPLEGRAILVWTEQGLGDEILIASMIPDVLARGARCILVCTNRLAPLFRRSFPTAQILTREDMKTAAAAAVSADFQASLSQLALYLRPTIASFPGRPEYLEADSEQTEEFRRRYKRDSTDRLVGIAWHSANPQASAEKSTPLPAWEDILRTPGYRFVSLQYGEHSGAYKALRDATGLSLIVDKTVDAKNDLERFAAQVAAMDLVISVSNTTVHFAGALGVPVWTLVPASVGRIWYWFLDRTDSPWYPTMRLFRQQRGIDWSPTLRAVARDLKQWP